VAFVCSSLAAGFTSPGGQIGVHNSRNSGAPAAPNGMLVAPIGTSTAAPTIGNLSSSVALSSQLNMATVPGCLRLSISMGEHVEDPKRRFKSIEGYLSVARCTMKPTFASRNSKIRRRIKAQHRSPVFTRSLVKLNSQRPCSVSSTCHAQSCDHHQHTLVMHGTGNFPSVLFGRLIDDI